LLTIHERPDPKNPRVEELPALGVPIRGWYVSSGVTPSRAVNLLDGDRGALDDERVPDIHALATH
jgi:hypothetical protein